MKTLQKVKVVLRNSTIAVIGSLVAMTASCAHKAPVPPKATIVASPVESKPVAPRTAVVAKKVDNAAVSAEAVRVGLDKAIAEADRLRKQKAASEKELDDMWKILTNEKENTIALVAKLDEAKKEVEILQTEAFERDREVTELRRDRQTMAIELAKTSDLANKLQADNTKLAKKASVYDFFRTWILWILAIVVVAAILRFVIPLILKSLKPIP